MRMRVPDGHCLNCGKLVDGATWPGHPGANPNPGDIAICLHCGHVAAFDATLRLRELTDAEQYEIAGDPTLIAMQKARGKVMRP